jgi:hypothetical protein
MYFHLGVGQKDSFEKVLDANPDVNFVFHGDQLISYIGDHQDLSQIEEILDNRPNVYYEVDELYWRCVAFAARSEQGEVLVSF